jgi:hypothetical protein
MELSRHRVCQWIKCKEKPTRRVTFAVRVFESADPAAPDLTPPVPEKRYLCAKHTEYVLRNYVDVNVSEMTYPLPKPGN